MHEIDPVEDTDGMVFRDVIMLTLMGFVTIVVLMIPHLNPPPTEIDARPPGSIIVEARWPDGSASDVDLWVQAPGDRPVGYSNRSGEVFDLLRDDLGHTRDQTNLNYEFAFSRGAPAGDYAVNLHLYSLGEGEVSVPVEVTVSMRDPVSARLAQIDRRDLTLRARGIEETVVRFRLAANGRVEPGSLNRLPIKLRGGG
jgi:hypothetical protein